MSREEMLEWRRAGWSWRRIGRECGVAGRTAWGYARALDLPAELWEAKGKRTVTRRGDQVGEVLTAEVVREWVWGERLRLEEIADRVGCTHAAAKRWIVRRVVVEYVGQPTQTARRWGQLKTGARDWCATGDDGRGGWLAAAMFGCSESLLLECRERAEVVDRVGRAECGGCGFWYLAEELEDGRCELCRLQEDYGVIACWQFAGAAGARASAGKFAEMRGE